MTAALTVKAIDHPRGFPQPVGTFPVARVAVEHGFVRVYIDDGSPGQGSWSAPLRGAFPSFLTVTDAAGASLSPHETVKAWFGEKERAPQKPLALDGRTIGETPAALYLAHLLTERNARTEARKLGRVLADTRELLNDVVACHLETSELRTASFGKLLPMIERSARESLATLARNGVDPFLCQLTENILVGEIRHHARRLHEASTRQKALARATPEGETVPMAKAVPLRRERTAADLQARSARYLARRAKRNTLYPGGTP